MRQKGDWQTLVPQKLGKSFLEEEARQRRRAVSTAVSVNRLQATVLRGTQWSRKSGSPGGGSVGQGADGRLGGERVSGDLS